MVLAILAPLIGVIGALLLSFGFWLIYAPAGYIAGGVLCLAWSWMVSRVLATSSQPERREAE